MRLLKLNKVIKRYADKMALRVSQLVQGMVMIGHLLGCFLHFYTIYENDCPPPPNVTANYTAPPCIWLDLLSPSERDSFSRYLASLYWAFAAMSTVGYGDLVPVNVAETAAVLIAEFAGVLSFASVVGCPPLASELASRGACSPLHTRHPSHCASLASRASLRPRSAPPPPIISLSWACHLRVATAPPCTPPHPPMGSLPALVVPPRCGAGRLHLSLPSRGDARRW